MDPHFHRLSDLFHQLGLPSDPVAIDTFIAAHRPLAPGVHLADAPFWSPSQAQFLREALAVDADWAEVVDALAARLIETPP